MESASILPCTAIMCNYFTHVGFAVKATTKKNSIYYFEINIQGVFLKPANSIISCVVIVSSIFNLQ